MTSSFRTALAAGSSRCALFALLAGAARPPSAQSAPLALPAFAAKYLGEEYRSTFLNAYNGGRVFYTTLGEL
jgi:hypothetical protein